MAPNPDLLRTEFLGLTVRFDDVDLSREDMALFFAGTSGRYGLNRLEYHADGGATMSGPDGAEFVLRPAQAASCGVTRLGLAEGLERVGGLLEEAIDRYRVGSMWIEDVTLVADLGLRDRGDRPPPADRGHHALRRGAHRAARRRGAEPGAAPVAPLGRGHDRLRARAHARRPGQDLPSPDLQPARGRAATWAPCSPSCSRSTTSCRAPSRTSWWPWPDGRRAVLTAGDALRRTSGYLAGRGSSSPRLDAEVLLAHVLGVERIALYTDHERPLTTAETDAYRALVARRGRREPVAYLTGERAFRRLRLRIGPAVLVPRPETEGLVDWALEAAPPGRRGPGLGHRQRRGGARPGRGAAGPAGDGAGPLAGGPGAGAGQRRRRGASSGCAPTASPPWPGAASRSSPRTRPTSRARSTPPPRPSSATSRPRPWWPAPRVSRRWSAWPPRGRPIWSPAAGC